MNKKIFYLFLLFLIPIQGFTQQIRPLSDKAEISIITVAPGKNLVDSWGHSAIRVKDPAQGIDLAYNYGTYDFNAPNFYGNFAKGKLLYILGVNRFHNFLRYYVNQNRSVKEQELNLSLPEKQQFLNYLQNNAQPKNRGYLYDFFYDNCATKLRDVAKDVLHEKVVFHYNFEKDNEYTLRNLIHKYSQKKHPWGTFGIDLALGAVIDRKAIPEEYIFLPDYVFKVFENAEISSDGTTKPLVNKTNILFEKKNKEKLPIITPVLVFSILAILFILITYKDLKRKKRSVWLDFILFFFTGLIGVFILLLWFATDHTATAKNYNFLWAFAPNMFMAFLVMKKNIKIWVRNYVLLLLILLCFLVILWVVKVQTFNIALIPIIIILLTRYLLLIKIKH